MKLSLPFGLLLATLSGCRSTSAPTYEAESSRQPNVVIFFTDDQGYGDLSSFGHPTLHTPHIDRLAREGAKLTQFYVASPVCSPSRAALLTGCYPKRVGMHGHVVFPEYDYGLHSNEVTLADLLGEAGYATGIFGKWHLGHRPGLLPLDQGFDTWLGVPYSNDMSRFHRPVDGKYPNILPLCEDERIIEWEPDQALFTKQCTEAAVEFIDEHHAQPFFLFVPYSMPHIPIYASADFAGTSPRGLYGDVIEEIDWSVGQVLTALERHGVDEETLVLFTSDNGPWLPYGAHGGSAGPLRGGKGSNWEGGQRVPCVLRYPPLVRAGSVRREVMTTLDIFPTVAKLAGVDLPSDRTLDGQDVSSCLAGEGFTTERPPFLYYTSKGALAGIRRGPWKLLFEKGELYQLEEDVSEQRNVAEQHPRLVLELESLARALDDEIEAHARPVEVVDELWFDPVLATPKPTPAR